MTGQEEVAFRKEGVDWNAVQLHGDLVICDVAFRKEGVDWNIL